MWDKGEVNKGKAWEKREDFGQGMKEREGRKKERKQVLVITVVQAVKQRVLTPVTLESLPLYNIVFASKM